MKHQLKYNFKDIKYKISSYSLKLISKKNSSNFIQALMDYGSAICTPNQPKCEDCIIQNDCLAFRKKLTNFIPFKKVPQSSKPLKVSRAYIIRNEFNQILVRRRSSTGMLQSMIEVPNDNWVHKKKDLIQDNSICLFVKKLSKLNENLIYSFSHFNLEVEIFFAKVKKEKMKGYRWLSLNKISQSGMPTFMKRIVKISLQSVKN